jgi:3-hydroxybutyryl-CoA dehydrogenase
MIEIKTVGVIGAGTMGSGIAIVAARAGFKTIVFDMKSDQLKNARVQTLSFFEKSVKRGKLNEDQVETILNNLIMTSDNNDLNECDVIIEAIFESLEAKHSLFRELDGICKKGTIFATNTSTLSITEIAGGSGRERQVVGMHFCLPAPLMKLVEMSRGLNTADEAFSSAWLFCENLGQKPVEAKDSPGFILNYFLVPWHNDVIRMIENGVAEPADIDLAVKTALGYPLGPCELLDMIGMDTQVLLSNALSSSTYEPRAACPHLVKKMVAAGHLGRKSGKGFYVYNGNAMFGA